LLLDEPLSALDRSLRDSLQTEIKDVQRRTGASVLYVTHDQEEALRLSDRIAVVNHGKVEQVGTPSEVYDAPASLFVAGCLGETNILSCTAADCRANHARVEYAAGDGIVNIGSKNIQNAGTKGFVAIRPEHVQFSEAGSTSANRLRGTVVEVAFLGAVVRYRIMVAGKDFIVRRAPADSQDPYALIGKDVELGWKEEDASFFWE
ncbi:MAG: ABC transporter ATP-binding protein, partial [Terriglobales bacterium]